MKAGPDPSDKTPEEWKALEQQMFSDWEREQERLRTTVLVEDGVGQEDGGIVTRVVADGSIPRRKHVKENSD